jgi:hypothetical protein
MTDSRRILLALDAAAHDPAAFEVLAQVAHELDAELAALIVQDIDLLRLSRLPFARELGALTALERTVDERQMGAALRARAQRTGERLAAALAAHAARLSLRHVEGKIVPQTLAAAAGSDFVLFGARRAERLPSRRRSLVLLLEDTPLPLSTLQLALQLERSLSVSLSVFVAAAEQAYTRVRDEVAAHLRGAARGARIQRLAVTEGHALARAVAREGAELIVLPRESRFATESSLRSVLAETSCALLWMR